MPVRYLHLHQSAFEAISPLEVILKATPIHLFSFYQFIFCNFMVYSSYHFTNLRVSPLCDAIKFKITFNYRNICMLMGVFHDLALKSPPILPKSIAVIKSLGII